MATDRTSAAAGMSRSAVLPRSGSGEGDRVGTGVPTAHSGSQSVAPRAGCTDDCQRPTPSQAHCGCCHVTFAGPYGFDTHRRNGTCRAPASFGYIERGGVWHRPGGENLAALHAREVVPDAD